MTQLQFEREVASATGESINTIRHRGFTLLEPEHAEPLFVYWDEVDVERLGIFPARLAAPTAA